MQRDPPTDLMECLDWILDCSETDCRKDSKDTHTTAETRRLHALEIIRSGADIHSVTEHDDTFLHLAIEHSFVDIVQLLLEKGIDVNALNGSGVTALHLACYYKTCTTLIPMLLYHGADPWIRDDDNATPLDLIFELRFFSIFNENLVETVENLCYYMFDQYTECGLSVKYLLIAAQLKPTTFREIVGTIKKVDLDDLAMASSNYIFTMPSENLRLILDKFDYVFIPIFLAKDLNIGIIWRKFRLENLYILVESHLHREFIDWLCQWHVYDAFLCSFVLVNDAPLASAEKIVYCLLSYGMEIDGEVIDTVYEHCGYNELFKLLRFMDVKPGYIGQLIPRLVFQVTGEIQQAIENPRFWVDIISKEYSKNSFSVWEFEPAFAYYCVPNLKDMCRKVEIRKNFRKKLLAHPRIPLLVEMARNVFRKYFIQRLGITSAKQFYESLELLPISLHHRKIIALETELY